MENRLLWNPPPPQKTKNHKLVYRTVFGLSAILGALCVKEGPRVDDHVTGATIITGRQVQGGGVRPPTLPLSLVSYSSGTKSGLTGFYLPCH